MDDIADIRDDKTGDAHRVETPSRASLRDENAIIETLHRAAQPLYQNKYRVESTRLKGRDYSENGYYFITICTHRREWVLGDIVDGTMQLSAIGEIVLQEWNESFVIRRELSCDQFVIMPNHIHGIVVIDNSTVETPGRASVQGGRASVRDGRAFLRAKSVSSFVAGFKGAVTKRVNEFRRMPGAPLWQTRFYDHIVRTEKSLHQIRDYIVNNPVNWHEDELNESKDKGGSL